MMRDERFKKLESETENEYIARMYKTKSSLGLTNKEVSEVLNSELGQNKAESTYRSIAHPFNEGFEIGYDKALSQAKGETKEELITLKLEKENYEQIKSYKDTVEINKDGTYTVDKLIGVENEDVLKDENYLLTCHGYDSKLWQIVSARNSKWNVQLKGGEVSKLYASKINIKPRIDNMNILELEEHFNKFSREYDGEIIKPKIINKDSNLMLVLPVYDLHYGKKSYSFETGKIIDEKVLEERYFNTLQDIINQVKHLKFEKIIYPIGSDMFNSDTIDNSTTRGTRQDNSIRWQELFDKGLELVIKGIDLLVDELKAPVDVFYVMGNHDTMASYYATQYLYAWYRKDDNVLVDKCAKARKYVEYGKCLIGFTHGDKEGKRIFNLMQTECAEAWGRTKYREWAIGHLHHEVVKENGGVKVRTVSTICGTDAWHYQSGYVGSLEQIQAFVWDKNRGLKNIVYGSFE